MANSATANGVSFEEYEFGEGDRVHVDWSEGNSPVDEFTGTVEDIGSGAGEVIVGVACDEGTYPESSIYGGTHDAAPEWITVLEDEE